MGLFLLNLEAGVRIWDHVMMAACILCGVASMHGSRYLQEGGLLGSQLLKWVR